MQNSQRCLASPFWPASIRLARTLNHAPEASSMSVTLHRSKGIRFKKQRLANPARSWRDGSDEVHYAATSHSGDVWRR